MVATQSYLTDLMADLIPPGGIQRLTKFPLAVYIVIGPRPSEMRLW